MIPFNKPYITGKEVHFIYDAVATGHISGNGKYTKLCQSFFEDKWGFLKCLLTTSCTDALEMAAILCDIKPGDEVIMPSYTFVSTANAFVLRGAKIVFADCLSERPGIDENKIEQLINPKTKVIVPVHYAGIACDMDIIMRLAKIHNLLVVEDAAQAIDSFYKGRPLGSIGHLGCFSFHETKNIQCGEGGLLAINSENFIKRAEIIWEKGTNRAEFFRGEVNKYAWVDIGSSFLPSEVSAAFLWAQLNDLETIQKKRIQLWQKYYNGLTHLANLKLIKLPVVPSYASNNGHLFYIICSNLKQRDDLIDHLRKNGIWSVFHYHSLHRSIFYKNKYDGEELLNTDFFSDTLLRLPMYYELQEEDQNYIINTINNFFNIS